MCIRAFKMDPWQLTDIPDWFVVLQEMWCENRDWFVVLQEMWCEDFDDTNYLIRWRNAYKKRKAQKAKVKEELLPVAWHPSKWWGWCVSNDEKRNRKIAGINMGFLCLVTGYKKFFDVKEVYK